MAGHSKYHNIKHRKNDQDKKRSTIFTKITQALSIVARSNPDPLKNSQLRNMISYARKQGFPKKNIIKILDKYSDSYDTWFEVDYECYSKTNQPFIVSVHTDNKNRSVLLLRTALKDVASRIVSPGSLLFLFEKIGIIKYEIDISEDVFLEGCLGVGEKIIDCYKNMNEFSILCSLSDLNSVSFFLNEKFKKTGCPSIVWCPKDNVIKQTEQHIEEMRNITTKLESIKDVAAVFSCITKINLGSRII